jgi:hypothetical protein
MRKLMIMLLMATMLALASPAMAGTTDVGVAQIGAMTETGLVVAVEDCTTDIEDTWTVDASAPPDMVEICTCEKKGADDTGGLSEATWANDATTAMSASETMGHHLPPWVVGSATSCACDDDTLDRNEILAMKSENCQGTMEDLDITSTMWKKKGQGTDAPWVTGVVTSADAGSGAGTNILRC